MSKKMKKFFSLMLVAMVMLVAACEQNVEIDTPKSEGLSFYAEIAMTRADLVSGENEEGKLVWNTVWEGGETLYVNDGNATYSFTNSSSDVNKFTCEEAGVSELLGKTVTVELNNGAEIWTMGRNGIKASASVENFAADKTVELVALNSFFRYTYTGEGYVELSLTYSTQDTAPFGYSSNYYPEDSNKDAEGNIWVAFDVPNGGDYATLSYSVNGVKMKETTINIAQGKVYNLGAFEDPSFKVYVTPQPKSTAADWATVNLYTWVEDGIGLEWPGQDISESTEVINGYTYYTFTYPITYVGKDVNVIVNNGSAQTADINLGTLDKDYYVVYTPIGFNIYDEAPSTIEDAPVFYLKPNSNWTQSSARFAAYFFGNGDKWVSMVDADGDGVYKVDVPSGYTKVIFCRMNPATTDNSWDNKWNQTADLTVEGHIGMLYSVTDNWWDSTGDNCWTEYSAN